MEKIYEMKLHDEICLDLYTNVLRVPGGWIYQYSTEWTGTSQFVPFSDEFQPRESESLLDPPPPFPSI